MKNRAIIATSSSGLLMTEIQSATSEPERCIVAHPWNPPLLSKLVELVVEAFHASREGGLKNVRLANIALFARKDEEYEMLVELGAL